MTTHDLLDLREALKDKLRACTTIDEVNATVRRIAPKVADMAARDPVGAIQIRNLAAWKRNCLAATQSADRAQADLFGG